MATAREADTQMDRDARRWKTLLLMISDSYSRMASNPDENYRGEQRKKCETWLAEMTKLYETGRILP